MLKSRHLIDPSDLTIDEIKEICVLAEKMIVDSASFCDVCRGKILAAFFLNRAPARGFHLRRLCSGLAAASLGFLSPP